MHTPHIRADGMCLCAAAIATLALNVLVSPLLPSGRFSAAAASSVYLIRQWTAAGIALLLVFGLVRLRESSLVGESRFATVAQTLALVGQVLLFAIEYGQASVVHDYAVRAPVALDAAIADIHGSLASGAIIAIAAFYTGWLLLAIALLRSPVSEALVSCSCLGSSSPRRSTVSRGWVRRAGFWRAR